LKSLELELNAPPPKRELTLEHTKFPVLPDKYVRNQKNIYSHLATLPLQRGLRSQAKDLQHSSRGRGSASFVDNKLVNSLLVKRGSNNSTDNYRLVEKS
jgi:hypothetical protein